MSTKKSPCDAGHSHPQVFVIPNAPRAWIDAWNAMAEAQSLIAGVPFPVTPGAGKKTEQLPGPRPESYGPATALLDAQTDLALSLWRSWFETLSRFNAACMTQGKDRQHIE